MIRQVAWTGALLVTGWAGLLAPPPAGAQGAPRVAAPQAFEAGVLRAEYQAESGTSLLRATFHSVADTSLRLLFRRGVNRLTLGPERGLLELEFSSDAPMDMAPGDSLSFLVRHELVDPAGGRHLVVQGRLVARVVRGQVQLSDEGLSLHRLRPPPAPRQPGSRIPGGSR